MDPYQEPNQDPQLPGDAERGFNNFRYSPMGVDDYQEFDMNSQPSPPPPDRHILR